MNELVKGDIVDMDDKLVGYYYHIYANRYVVAIYGYRQEMTKTQLLDKVQIMGLNLVPILD